MNKDLLGTGRIYEIIDALLKSHNVISTRHLDEKIKLDALLTALQLSASELDSVIADNSPVYRTIKGHAFEVVFEHLVLSAGYTVVDVGGDQAIDLTVNDHDLQLKTPTLAGTKGVYVQYKTHKTHGAKSERESMDYYHHVDEFADFLVGLISYEPLKIIFLSKDELPTHPKDQTRIRSPFTVVWADHPGLNAFSRIGVEGLDLSYSDHVPTDLSKELLPKSSRRLNLKTDIILDTIIFDTNFRIWDMSIRGFSREVVISNFLRSIGKRVFNPVQVRNDGRGDKSDFAMKSKDGSYKYFQVKGVSTNNCKFTGKDSIVATETQLTRGRVNDHPTQSRLYLETDFDYLILNLDPPYVNLYEKERGNDVKLQWKQYCIPTSELDSHHKYGHRIKSLQTFRYDDLDKYLVSEDFFDQFI